MNEKKEFYFSLPREFYWVGEGRYLEVNCMITAGRDVPLTAHYKDIKYKRVRSGLDLVHLLKTVCILKYLLYSTIFMTIFI